MTWNIQELDDNTLRLLCVDGLGGHTLATLVQRAGGLVRAAEAILCGDASAWLPHGNCNLLKERMERHEIDAMRWSAESVGALLVTVMDDEFPPLLLPLPACPAVLWFRGNLGCIHIASTAIVGSRRCTTYGIDQATSFSAEIASANITIISGGARGIDAAAHRSALRHDGHTAVVLGSGLSVVYPPEHASLFESIIDEGGIVISEFPCNRTPRPAYFPRRNRIVSGLSSVVLVVEAAARSGALITARIAVEEHGRQAFAIPGRNGDPASVGCLQSIRDGWIEIAVNPQQIIQEAEESWKRLSRGICRVVNNGEELQ